MKKFEISDKIFKNIFANKIRAGFSLVEIMTVLFVISLGLLGVLSLMVQNIQSQNVNKGALIAYQLSQEGIELIRRTRDSNWTARATEPSRTWNHNLTPGHYIMDYRDLAPRLINTPGQTTLKQDNLGFYYNPTPSGDINQNSVFSRYIDLIPNSDNPNSIIVRSTVVWTEHSKSFNYALETILYDWK